MMPKHAVVIAGLVLSSGIESSSAFAEIEGTLRTVVEATIEPGLEKVQLHVRMSDTTTVARDRTTLVLAADRFRDAVDLPAGTEAHVYPRTRSLGGFEDLDVRIDGVACRGAPTTIAENARVLACEGPRAAGQVTEVEVHASLKVPNRYGPFGRRGRQLTLGGGWFPYLVRSPSSEPILGRVEVRVTLPAGFGAVLGSRYFPPIPGVARTVEETISRASQIPLVVVPPGTQGVPVAGGRAVVVSAARDDAARERRTRLLAAVGDGLRFLHEEALPLPSPDRPLVVVEAPLRHNLARATDGVVLVSDRAFRLLPVERFLVFHRFPILREMFTVLALRGFGGALPWKRHVVADAIGAWLRDRYVRSRFGRAEDAFDVLDLWAFIPAIDSMLYAPQLPFLGTYFRLIDEEDPLRSNLIDFPAPHPRGKIVYEKLVDRVGRTATDGVLMRAVAGAPLPQAVSAVLREDADAFLMTWMGPHPAVRYRLAESDARSVPAARCRAASTGEDDDREGDRCYEARAVIEREGDVVAEPIQVRFEDDEGRQRVVSSAAISATRRTVTATLTSELALVEIDPFGRIAETPSIETPSPRFDNRSSPRWRFLINNFNILFSPTAGTVDTALDLGFSRIRDVRWRHAIRAAVAPETVSLSARTSYAFGRAITADQLGHWIGAVTAGEYLRRGFAGVEDDGFAWSAAVYYGYDDRQTAWAPEAGQGFRLSVAYSRIFADLLPTEEAGLTADAVSVTARALKSWRFGAAHQVSLRANAGAYVWGTPRAQLLYAIGGRLNVRGYQPDDAVGRLRGIASAEWVHPLIPDLGVDGFKIAWATGIDGALYADLAVVADDFEALGQAQMLGDIGYGLRIYIDYFGVRPGVMSVDLAFPLVDPETGRAQIGPPAVYIDFAQSFLVF